MYKARLPCRKSSHSHPERFPANGVQVREGVESLVIHITPMMGVSLRDLAPKPFLNLRVLAKEVQDTGESIRSGVHGRKGESAVKERSWVALYLTRSEE
jgi:hypothetical protein